jgi:hypothetical protein
MRVKTPRRIGDWRDRYGSGGVRSLSTVLGALEVLLAFACWGRGADPTPGGPLEGEIPVSVTAGRGGGDQGGAGAAQGGASGNQGGASGNQGGAGGNQGGAQGVSGGTGNGAAAETWTEGILAERVEALIEQHCVSCHQEPGPDGNVPAIMQLASLLAAGWVIPGSSEDSPLLLGFQDGHAQLTRGPTRGELALVELFLDQISLSDAVCRRHDALYTDAALALMARDVATLPAGDRPFVRYLSVAYVNNATGCEVAIDERQAMFAAVNGVSTAEAIVAPVPIDASELIYRLDLRSYGWDRAIHVDGDAGSDLPEGIVEGDGVDFPDAWSAIVSAAGPFAVEYTGPEADVLRLETQSAVPLLPVNAFVHSVGAADLYYALLGVGRDLEAERLELGVDLFSDVQESSLKWASFESWGPDGSPREVTLSRAPQSRPERAYWMAAEQHTNDAETIYDTFFESESAGSQIIFHLPNGLQAYAIDVDGQRANQAPIHRECGGCAEREPLGPAACPACHGEGLLPIDNQVRAAFDARPSLLLSWGITDLAEAQERYPTTAELDALRQADDAVHLDARARAGLILGRLDPVSGVYYEFERKPIDADRAAAELGVSVESLLLGADLLDPRLAALREPTARIDRATFAEVFAAARCQLSVGARNRPAGCP